MKKSVHVIFSFLNNAGPEQMPHVAHRAVGNIGLLASLTCTLPRLKCSEQEAFSFQCDFSFPCRMVARASCPLATSGLPKL